MANPKLGKCCNCECGGKSVRNIMMLDRRSPEPGDGCWGCFQCGLPMQGAVAVLCDACLIFIQAAHVQPKYACLGAPEKNRRIPVEQLTEVFEHDMSKHPGE